jgi:hypothetical protein
MKKILFVFVVLAFTRYQLLDHFGLVPRLNPMAPAELLYADQRTA